MFASKKANSVEHTSATLDNRKNSLFFQPRLNVGKSGDKYEAEADKIADTIIAKGDSFAVSSPFFSPTPFVQQQTEEEQETDLQQKPLAENISVIGQILPEEEEVQEKEEESEEVQSQPEELAMQEKKESPVQEKPIAPLPVAEIQKKPEELQEMEEEEEEPIQEKSFVQKSEETIPGKEEESQTVQAKTDGNPVASSSVESQLNSSKGSGSPLPEDTRSEMESGFGTDFGNVRVHTDSAAVQMSKGLGAQAFTQGSDIYFNEGKYNPASNSGKHLLAHELTHTVQQGASVQKKMIQKVDEPTTINNSTQLTVNSSTPNLPSDFNYAGTFIDIASGNQELKIPKVSLPAIKQRNSSKYGNTSLYQNGIALKVRPGSRGRTSQVDNWRSDVRNNIRTHFTTKIQEAQNSGGVSQGYYFFKLSTNPNFIIFGTETDLLERLEIPFWNKMGSPMSFQVDHVVEDQLEGKDVPENYELLESSANMSAGSNLGAEIRRKINGALLALNTEKEHLEKSGNPVPVNIPNASVAKSNYEITFNEISYDLEISGQLSDNDYWSREDIKGEESNRSAHLDMLNPLTGNEIESLGNNQEPQIFFSETGGVPQHLPSESELPKLQWLSRVNLINYNLVDSPAAGQAAGNLNIEAFKANQLQEDNSLIANSKSTPDSWQLLKIPGIYGGAIEKQSVKAGIQNSLRLPGMSPIEIDDIEVRGTGLTGRGRVLPTLSLIEGLEIEIIIDGAEIQLRKTFSIEDLHFPSPFEIHECGLTVFVSNQRGLGIEGQVDFGINNVGEGHIGAAASTSGGFELEGAFNFDSELFDPAEINVEYKDNIWTIGGQIGIPEGKVRGVKNATITATYSENNFSATGEAELDIPGIQRGTMSVNYGPEGFSIAGNFNLSDDIPGIRGGSVEARVSKAEGAENYDIFVSGTAQPAIPGIDSTLTVTYENGALTIEGSAAYNRGMLSGTVNIGATNRAIGDDGQPSGEPDDTMRVYGGGSLTLTLTPWLQATAGVNFLPNGEIEVTGRIGLPGTVDVFDRRSIDRNLFNIPAIEIPIFAIPLGPRSIGLVARITGGLDFSAGFGPGQIRELSAEVTYNPDHEDQTTITGRGLFAIPADAGLTLRGDLGLGVSIGIASLSGGIEIAGTLGLQGEAAAAVDVNWSPQTGLAIDATGSITVNPKFTFDINAFVRASLDLWVTSISETWRYNLASFSWGPDIQFGITFPVHYREGEPFDMSFDDIQVTYPDLDIVDMAIGLARDIKDNIFD